MSEGKRVLFVCLGNICRSPIAEAVFKQMLQEKGLQTKWFVDSAALGPWHVGKPPDKRARDVLKEQNIGYSHKARQITDQDFTKFNFILGMDDDNISALNDISPPNSTAAIELLGSYDPKGETQIRDPYYDRGSEGFVTCFVQCKRSCETFLQKH